MLATPTKQPSAAPSTPADELIAQLKGRPGSPPTARRAVPGAATAAPSTVVVSSARLPERLQQALLASARRARAQPAVGSPGWVAATGVTTPQPSPRGPEQHHARASASAASIRRDDDPRASPQPPSSAAHRRFRSGAASVEGATAAAAAAPLLRPRQLCFGGPATPPPPPPREVVGGAAAAAHGGVRRRAGEPASSPWLAEEAVAPAGEPTARQRAPPARVAHPRPRAAQLCTAAHRCSQQLCREAAVQQQRAQGGEGEQEAGGGSDGDPAPTTPGVPASDSRVAALLETYRLRLHAALGAVSSVAVAAAPTATAAGHDEEAQPPPAPASRGRQQTPSAATSWRHERLISLSPARALASLSGSGLPAAGGAAAAPAGEAGAVGRRHDDWEEEEPAWDDGGSDGGSGGWRGAEAGDGDPRPRTALPLPTEDSEGEAAAAAGARSPFPWAAAASPSVARVRSLVQSVRRSHAELRGLLDAARS